MIKRATTSAFLAISMLALPGCTPSASPSQETDATTSEPISTSQADVSQSGDGSPSGSAAASTQATAMPGAGTATQVPLTPGVYVLEGTSCENPANAAWRVWDGRGLSGSSTRACRATILSQDGKTYTLRNSCENTYDGSRSDETIAMTVTDQVHFTVQGRSFASCSTAQVPAALRERLTGQQ
ncbi:hypothetical protein [Pararhizobium mangrovi]|uniref:Lipoprotein n=1 Tax=Pararhizobium mangrovi TaxID=2590452 RepID=A0A506U3Y2_9HYPH|nr:hypothetical protein [Pararhizobium mangrovi]TPW27715.1 hypothetical protein FJU11_10760 [Pararhizobium mangrovi]